METSPAGVYESRNPRATSLYALVEDYYEEFERVYDDRYRQQYGPWRSVIGEVMRKYLECGMVHPAFSLARLHYDRDAGIVTYDRRPSSRSIPSATAPEQFSPLDALIALTAFIPEKGQQVVRYCGYYSNRTRGQRRRQPQSAAGISSVAVSGPEPEPDDFRRHSKRAWARLIRKVWAADPLACPKCGARLRIISFIEDPDIIEKILRHLKLWNPPTRPPPPRASVTLEMDADFLAWEAAGRLFDGID